MPLVHGSLAPMLLCGKRPFSTFVVFAFACCNHCSYEKNMVFTCWWIPQLLVNVTTILFLMVLFYDVASSCTVHLKTYSLYHEASHKFLHVDEKGVVIANSTCGYQLDFITVNMPKMNESTNIMKMYIFDPYRRKYICAQIKKHSMKLITKRRIRPSNRKMCQFTDEVVDTAHVRYRPVMSKNYISFNQSGHQRTNVHKKGGRKAYESYRFLNIPIESIKNRCQFPTKRNHIKTTRHHKSLPCE